jgi:hypothetical protein
MVTPMLLLDPTTLETATEQRVTLYGITWEQYTGLSEIFVDRFPRMTYLNYLSVSSKSIAKLKPSKTIANPCGNLMISFGELYYFQLCGTH